MTSEKDRNTAANGLLLTLGAIFAGVLVAGVAVGSKLVEVFGVVASASAFTYPVTFLITDTVAEVWGKEQARRLVLNGFLVLVLSFVIIQVILVVPGSGIWENEAGFNAALGLSLRLIVAGTIAYLVSQLHDVWAFHFWRNRTKGRFLWLRNNASTVVSQLIDTAIFIGLGFAGVAPFWDLFWGQYLLKTCIALIDTPLVYLAVAIIRRRFNLAPPNHR